MLSLENKTIVVTGNGNVISDGSTTISPSINTDYGYAPVSNSLSELFTIKNYGAIPVSIGSVSITGLNAADFAVIGLTFPRTIQSGDSLILNIACTPTTPGIKSAVIHINSAGCLAEAVCRRATTGRCSAMG